MQLTPKRILVVTAIAEGGLLLAFLLWAHYRGYPYHVIPRFSELVLGVFLSLPIFVVSFTFFGPHCERIRALRSCFVFKDQIVAPLAQHLDVTTAAIVSLAAGIGEEAFFRGLLQTEFGLIVASVLFSVLHFGWTFFHYLLIGTVYVVIGFYFGMIVLHTNSLWAAAIAHGCYDFIALLYMRYIYKGPAKQKVLEPDIILRR